MANVDFDEQKNIPPLALIHHSVQTFQYYYWYNDQILRPGYPAAMTVATRKEENAAENYGPVFGTFVTLCLSIICRLVKIQLLCSLLQRRRRDLHRIIMASSSSSALLALFAAVVIVSCFHQHQTDAAGISRKQVPPMSQHKSSIICFSDDDDDVIAPQHPPTFPRLLVQNTYLVILFPNAITRNNISQRATDK